MYVLQDTEYMLLIRMQNTEVDKMKTNTVRTNNTVGHGYRRARRAAAIRRQRILFVRWAMLLAGLTITLSLTLALVFGGRVNAQDSAADTWYKYYRTLTVADGDTLWAYAEAYRCDADGQSKQSYIDEVKAINHLSDDAIREGQTLILPYYSTTYVAE